jgi:hypothetical protein
MDDEAYADRNTDSSKFQSEPFVLVEEQREWVRFLTRASLSRATIATRRTGASSSCRSATGETQEGVRRPWWRRVFGS